MIEGLGSSEKLQDIFEWFTRQKKSKIVILTFTPLKSNTEHLILFNLWRLNLLLQYLLDIYQFLLVHLSFFQSICNSQFLKFIKSHQHLKQVKDKVNSIQYDNVKHHRKQSANQLRYTRIMELESKKVCSRLDLTALKFERLPTINFSNFHKIQ